MSPQDHLKILGVLMDAGLKYHKISAGREVAETVSWIWLMRLGFILVSIVLCSPPLTSQTED